MNHELYMQRCLELAQHGLRAAMPNPSVGAVLVHNGRIIGEGHTSPYGGPHGEVNCINSVKPEDRHLIPHATLYVSLEPCSHFGKTPPCCDLIIAQQISRIVVGTQDPHEKVAGNGIHKLREAGKEVIVGVLEKQCRESNRRFFTFHEKKRPYIILKWAQSADGFIAPIQTPGDNTTDKKPVWISNRYSRQLVHKWRSEEMAIVAGSRTVLSDNPSLDVRSWTGPNPVRLIIDRNGSITDNYTVKNQKIKTIVLTERRDFANLDNLRYEYAPLSDGLADAVCQSLYANNLQSAIVEGGRQVLQAFIEAGLWDEARVFTGPVFLGKGIPAPDFNFEPTERQIIGTDELLIFRNHGQYDNI